MTMLLKRRKRANKRHLCLRCAATLVFSMALVCPLYRLTSKSLATTRQDSTFVPHHSLQHQLVQTRRRETSGNIARTKESVATRKVGGGGAIHVNVQSDIYSTEETKRHNSEHANTKDHVAKIAAFLRENRKTRDEAIRGGANITISSIPPASASKRIRTVATNSSLSIQSPVSNEPLHESKTVHDFTNRTNNNNTAHDSQDAPTRRESFATANATASKQQPQSMHLRGSNISFLQQQPTRHYPTYFTNEVPLQNLLHRMNLVTPYTGCSIAAFQYNLGKHAHPEFNDCFVHCGKPFAKTRGIRVDNAQELIQPNDTLFVQFNKLDHFVHRTMHEIQVDYVLISGNEQKVEPISKETFHAIVNNPHVLHWFMQNVDVYSHDWNHSKISPWPYGTNPKKLAYFAKELLLENQQQDYDEALDKKTLIYKSGFSRATNPQRHFIPFGPRVPITQYLRDMRASRYIISPDGDRPECYRHYEAIGMGSMPITQLNPKTHSHFGDNVIYNNTNWNLTELGKTLASTRNPRVVMVNRRLVFEEYWMEYVERIVGRPLRWYDPSRDVHSSLQEIQHLVSNDSFVPRDEVCVVANGAPFVGHRGPPQDVYAILTQEKE